MPPEENLMLRFAMMVWALAAGLSAPPKFDAEKLPYRAAWGQYTILVEKTGTEEFTPQRARILDERGEVVREVRDERIMDVTFPRVTGGAAEDLHISTYSGGAHCCSTDYFFTREGGVRNLLIFNGRNGGINGLKDLNGDGRLEIVASLDALAYFGGLAYAASPWMVMVIGWDGQRYVDQTPRYPERSRAAAREDQTHFLRALRRRGNFAEEERRSAAAGYYANSLVTGAGPAARAWLLPRLPAATRRWFLREEADLKAAALSGPSRLSVSQEKVLQPKEE
jgi:hypothetical protein